MMPTNMHTRQVVFPGRSFSNISGGRMLYSTESNLQNLKGNTRPCFVEELLCLMIKGIYYHGFVSPAQWAVKVKNGQQKTPKGKNDCRSFWLTWRKEFSRDK